MGSSQSQNTHPNKANPVNQIKNNTNNDPPAQSNKDDVKLPKIKSTHTLLSKVVSNPSHQNSSYDYIIDNISFTDNSLIKITDKTNSGYQNEKSIILGIIGNVSSGKTHIINKILPSINLPNTPTKGISIKRANQIIVLDTGSFDHIENNNSQTNEINEMIREKALQRDFTLKFVIDNSDILICVLNESITLDDIKIINTIKERIKTQTVIILHNLNHTEHTENAVQIADAFKKSTLNISEREFIKTIPEKNKIYYHENCIRNRDNSEVNCVHYIYCKENSDAGKYFNEITIENIKTQIKVITTLHTFNPIEKIKLFISENSLFYYKKAIQSSQIQYDKSNGNLMMVNKAYEGKEMSFNPRRMFYIKDNQLTIIIELPYKPNDFKVKAAIVGDNNVFTFTGRIEQNKFDFSSISLGRFYLDVKIPTKLGILKKTSPLETKREKGKIKISYDIIENKGIGDEEEEKEEKNNNIDEEEEEEED